ncbi:hypothetical protein F5887DRAFT_962637 [Amanita rubescens]|nr:hypothetical protein F5887DRAFT_962637 [Amanita rubescens]
MHASSSAANSCPIAADISSHPRQQTMSLMSMTVPVNALSIPFDDSDLSTVNYSAPQCCHCGYRGAHSPTCPFK